MHFTNPFGCLACLEHVVPLRGPKKIAEQEAQVSQEAAKTQADARRLAKAGRLRDEPPPRRRAPHTPVLCAYAPHEGEEEWGDSTLPDAPSGCRGAARQPTPTKLRKPVSQGFLTTIMLSLLCMGIGTAVAPVHPAPAPAPASAAQGKAGWGVGAAGSHFKKKKSHAPVPTLGTMTKKPFKVSRFYGRGCAVVDIDGDGNEDVWLSNGDNDKAQDLFGVDACSSHLYLGDGSGEFRDVPVLPAAPESPKRRKRKTLPDSEAADAFASLLEGEKPLGVTSDDTTSQWGQVFFVSITRLPLDSRI